MPSKPRTPLGRGGIKPGRSPRELQLIVLSGQRFFHVSSRHHTHTHTLPTRRFIWEDELISATEYEEQVQERLTTDPEAEAKAKAATIDFDK
jgi:hypothetical protein